MQTSDHPGIQTLRRLRTLSQFSDPQLRKLSENLTIYSAPKKQRLIARGCAELFSLYLLEGTITTIAVDGVSKTIKSQPDGELSPVAQIRPCIYDVDAESEVRYIKIYIDQLTEFAQQLEQQNSDDMEVFTIEQSDHENELTIKLFQDLMTGNVALPSLPDVAQRIQQAFTQKSANVGLLANIIQSDPAITAKIIMISNSVLYRGQDHIDTLNQAIVRLGLEATQKQVMTYAVNELFREKSSAMKTKMQKLWKHSQKVASLSRILARKSKCFDPAIAQLAGLIHDLGEIAILQYFDTTADALSYIGNFANAFDYLVIKNNVYWRQILFHFHQCGADFYLHLVGIFFNRVQFMDDGCHNFDLFTGKSSFYQLIEFVDDFFSLFAGFFAAFNIIRK